MTEYVRNIHVFLNAQVAASASGWYPVDWKYGHQQRSVLANRGGDEIVLETKVSAPGGTVSVISTATSWTAGTLVAAVLEGPFTHIRARKVGTSGACTVVGII